MRPTKQELEKKRWYRVMKVILLIIFIGITLFGFLGFNELRPQEEFKQYDQRGYYSPHKEVEGSWTQAIFWFLAIVIVGFCFLLIVREIILYIIYGKRNNPRKRFLENLENYWKTGNWHKKN